MKRNGIKLFTIVLLVALLILTQGCGQREDVEVGTDPNLEEEADDEIIEEPKEIRIEVTGDRLAVRNTPGTSNKPGGDVLERVDSGQILILVNKHNNTVNLDGYIWWEVYNPMTNTTGWSASKYLSELTD